MIKKYDRLTNFLELFLIDIKIWLATSWRGTKLLLVTPKLIMWENKFGKNIFLTEPKINTTQIFVNLVYPGGESSWLGVKQNFFFVSPKPIM